MKHQNLSRALPLLSIDNRYTSCLERKQQTCGVFGLELSVTGITNITLKNKHEPKDLVYHHLVLNNSGFVGTD